MAALEIFCHFWTWICTTALYCTWYCILSSIHTYVICLLQCSYAVDSAHSTESTLIFAIYKPCWSNS